MFSFSLPLFSLLTLASSQSFTIWTPPGPDDLRSPCPGLNSLANHGFIPHDGKGLTIPILIKGLKDGLNVGADFSTVIGGAGLLSVPSSPLATSFTLKDIRKHNFPIEHDASLSRADFNLDNGDNWMFNQSIFDTVLAYYDGMTETSIAVASAAKYVFFCVLYCMLWDEQDVYRLQVQSSQDRAGKRSEVHIHSPTICSLIWRDRSLPFYHG